MTLPSREKITIVAGPKSWIEGDAIAQLERVANLPHVQHVYGMPGVHPGPGHPIDAVFEVEDWIFPHLVGADIGCGMGWWWLNNPPRKPQRWAKRIRGMEQGVSDPGHWLDLYGVQPCGFEHSLGTVGQGNHFAEFLVPDGILNPAAYARLTNEAKCLLLVHSGSRGFGEQILHNHTRLHQDRGLNPTSEEGFQYQRDHEHALHWARVNRAAIAGRLLEMIGIEGVFLHDLPHNFVEPLITTVDLSAGEKPIVHVTWVHRKGAIPSNRGGVIIPGSRGSHSYLVEPIVGNTKLSGGSLSHGAGRKMSRRDARVKFNAQRDSIAKLRHTKFNSIVICSDREMLMEEAPEAYKDISRVVQDLVDHDLVRVVAMLKPVITYKIGEMRDEC